MAIWWTEDDISKVARDVLTGDVGKQIVRKHIDRVLREEVTRAIGAEMRTVAERLGEEGKASLQHKLNSVYATQAERLTKRLSQLETELAAAAPAQQQRLEAFEKRLIEVSASLEGWLDEPTRSLQTLVTENLNSFKAETDTMVKKSNTKAQTRIDQMLSRADEVMQDHLYDLVLSAVREHVKSLSFEGDKLSNKQVATAKGMSLRAVKRMRRLSQIDVR